MYVRTGCVVCSSGVVSPSSASAERASESSPILSGLYSYHIPTNTWTKLRDNQLEPQPKLGQSMIFDPVCSSMHYVCDGILMFNSFGADVDRSRHKGLSAVTFSSHRQKSPRQNDSQI